MLALEDLPQRVLGSRLYQPMKILERSPLTCSALGLGAGLVAACHELPARDAPWTDAVGGSRESLVYSADPSFSVSKDDLQHHVEYLAQEHRGHGSGFLEAAQEYCLWRLELAGYEVRFEPVKDVPKPSPYPQGDPERVLGRNVVGVRPGTTRSNEHVVLAAHIDSVPECNGADDNATGVAAVLEAARVLAQTDHARTLVAICLDGEEGDHERYAPEQSEYWGLLGSWSYAYAAQQASRDIRAAFVLDMVGYTNTEPNSQVLPEVPFEPDPVRCPETYFACLFPDAYREFVDNQRAADFITFLYDAPQELEGTLGSDPYVHAMRYSAPFMGLKTIALPMQRALLPFLTDALRSDHAPFWNYGYPAVLITDSGNFRNPRYHCEGGADDPSSLDYDFALRVTEATIQGVTEALDQQP